MEQYIHTLIPIDSRYYPEPVRVGAFFDWLLRRPNFRLIVGKRWQPGLVVRRFTGRMRESKNPWTGETLMRPDPDWAMIESCNEIPARIDGAAHFTVFASGEWKSDDLPIALFTTDGKPFAQDYLCQVGCELRPTPVSTSAWDVEAGRNIHNVPSFGSSPCNPDDDTGIFPNPWNGEAVKVPHAGCARFWIEFEFGKFIYPRVDNTFDLLSPSIVREAEQCFQTKFVQGCRFW